MTKYISANREQININKTMINPPKTTEMEQGQR